MRELFKLIKRMGIQRKYIFLLLLRAPFDALRTWMLANLMKSVFRCLEKEHIERLPEICAVYGLICTLMYIYNGTIWSLYAAFCAKTEVWLQKEMLQKILNLPLRRVESHFSGEWITKLNSDIQAAFAMMNDPINIPHLIVSIINVSLAAFWMLRSNTLLLGITCILILPQFFVNYGIVLKSISNLKKRSQNALAESTSVIKPLIADAETILLYNAGSVMIKKCDETSRKLMKINMKMHVRNAISDAATRLFGIGGYFIILLMGYKLMQEGIMAFSDMVYCFQVRGSILAGMSMFMNCLNNIKTNSVCIKRVNATLDE